MRITPPHAGKTCYLFRLYSALLGSPPLTRERRNHYPLVLLSQRITPADAGKTYCECRVLPAIAGSPPLTRERLVLISSVCRYIGITPAYAGKTTKVLQYHFHARDHPRLRGKDRCDSLTEWAYIGSPPLTRERLCCLTALTILSGITPADAGTTPSF